MAKKSRMSMFKRQREQEKSEKAARKRMKRHGIREVGFTEPEPTVRPGSSLRTQSTAEEDPSDGSPDENTEQE